jgi:hypothetical protein
MIFPNGLILANNLKNFVDDDWDNSAIEELTRAAWMTLAGIKDCPTAAPTKEYIELCRTKTLKSLEKLLFGKE